MIFEETPLAGAYVVHVEEHADDRGFFGRLWCADEFDAAGLDMRVSQVNVGFSVHRGTLRGLHFQRAPHGETKLVRCTAGAVYDVVVDLRPDSPTHTRWFGVELTPDNHLQLYVPAGFAHGYQTLRDRSEICYQASVPYTPDSATGVRFDDPVFGIDWPEPVTAISEADRSWPDYLAGQS